MATRADDASPSRPIQLSDSTRLKITVSDNFRCDAGMDRVWNSLLAIGLTDLEVFDKSGVFIANWTSRDDHQRIASGVPGVIGVEVIPLQKPDLEPVNVTQMWSPASKRSPRRRAS